MNSFTVRAISFAIGFAIGMLILFTAKYAPAGAYEQVICDNEPDPATCLTIQNWYYRALDNNGGGCCGLGDGYWTDDVVRVTDRGLYVRITDPRSCKGPAPAYDDESGTIPPDTEKEAGCIRKPDLDGKLLWVPADKVDRKGQGNPNGQPFPAVYCFFPGGGA